MRWIEFVSIVAPRLWAGLGIGIGLVVGLSGAGCAGISGEVESLDLSTLDSDEGVFVVRFVTSTADGADPDLHYRLSIASSKSSLLAYAGYKGDIQVDAQDGPVPIVRELGAGDYYFKVIHTPEGSANISVRFTVRPGQVTYIGDLRVEFLESDGLLLGKDHGCKLAVGTEPVAVMSQLRARYPSVPAVETMPMVIEGLAP